jgi:hypothetical protein
MENVKRGFEGKTFPRRTQVFVTGESSWPEPPGYSLVPVALRNSLHSSGSLNQAPPEPQHETFERMSRYGRRLERRWTSQRMFGQGNPGCETCCEWKRMEDGTLRLHVSDNGTQTHEPIECPEYLVATQSQRRLHSSSTKQGSGNTTEIIMRSSRGRPKIFYSFQRGWKDEDVVQNHDLVRTASEESMIHISNEERPTSSSIYDSNSAGNRQSNSGGPLTANPLIGLIARGLRELKEQQPRSELSIQDDATLSEDVEETQRIGIWSQGEPPPTALPNSLDKCQIRDDLQSISDENIRFPELTRRKHSRLFSPREFKQHLLRNSSAHKILPISEDKRMSQLFANIEELQGSVLNEPTNTQISGISEAESLVEAEFHQSKYDETADEKSEYHETEPISHDISSSPPLSTTSSQTTSLSRYLDESYSLSSRLHFHDERPNTALAPFSGFNSSATSSESGSTPLFGIMEPQYDVRETIHPGNGPPSPVQGPDRCYCEGLKQWCNNSRSILPQPRITYVGGVKKHL